MPNRLSRETSPYLLQHAHNPVDWFPWGAEALERAKRLQKPIFLSIGYSACHWCHVMEKESFENPETAKILNQHFVSIKVDREERPDLDHIYMSAVQAMTQRGGWPMSVFLTPELQPFYGGTYFPPEDRYGMPSFNRVLLGVANAWGTKREEVTKSAIQISQAVKELSSPPAAPTSKALSQELIEQALLHQEGQFDDVNGGFGSAPKFFHSMDLRLCLRVYNRTGRSAFLKRAIFTLEKMAAGGIFDQLGGGFHRYSTDAVWLAPHFEKMLYDNALLTETYLEAFQITQSADFARVARETLEYVLREMTSTEGGFFSSQDADSEGKEGKFFVWQKQEIESALGSEAAALFCEAYGVTETGNWEETNILHQKFPLEALAKKWKTEKNWIEDTLAFSKRKLLSIRNERTAPGRDEKILASWNGMMIQAMALGHQVLGDDRYLTAAKSAGDFIWQKLVKPVDENKVELFHTYKDGQARFTGYLDDYAQMGMGFLSLYESTFDPLWLARAIQIEKSLWAEFWDSTESRLYFTSSSQEVLLCRPQEIHDGATPSATAMALTFSHRLSRFTSSKEAEDRVQALLKSFIPQMEQVPLAMSQYLLLVDLFQTPPLEFIFAHGNDPEENELLLREIRSLYLPNRVLAAPDSQLPLAAEKQSQNSLATLYVCENSTCNRPWVGTEEILKELKRFRKSHE